LQDTSIAPMIFNGAYRAELFNSWVEPLLIKALKPEPTVAMDHAAFHKSNKTQAL
jgi:hypothetical protein